MSPGAAIEAEPRVNLPWRRRASAAVESNYQLRPTRRHRPDQGLVVGAEWGGAAGDSAKRFARSLYFVTTAFRSWMTSFKIGRAHV